MPRTLGLGDVHSLKGRPKKDLVVYPYQFDEKEISEYLELLKKMRPDRREPEGILLLAAYFAAMPSGLTARLVRGYSFIQMDTSGKVRFSNKPAGWIRGRHKQRIPIITANSAEKMASLQKIAEFVKQQKSSSARRKSLIKGGAAVTLTGLLTALAADGIVSAPKVVSRFGAHFAAERINNKVPGISPYRLEHNKLTTEELSLIDRKDVQKYQKYVRTDRTVGNFQAKARFLYLPAAFGAGVALARRNRLRWPVRRTPHRPRK